MKPYTVFARKQRHSTYISHGVKSPEGGSFSTMDAGWSLKRAIAYQIARLPKGTVYQIEKNGVIQPCQITKS